MKEVPPYRDQKRLFIRIKPRINMEGLVKHEGRQFGHIPTGQAVVKDRPGDYDGVAAGVEAPEFLGPASS